MKKYSLKAKMITLKDYMECIDYRIADGSEYMWRCYGHDVYMLDSNSTYGLNTVCVVFDTKTQVVYQMEAWDYSARRSYRWINPDYIDAFKAECKRRKIDFTASIDDEKFIDIEVVSDMLEKASAIAKHESYDPRIQVELTLDDSEMFQLMTMAHERDITLNQMVEHVLTLEIERRKADEASTPAPGLSMTKDAIRKREARAKKKQST
jgi:hypothetical protein